MPLAPLPPPRSLPFFRSLYFPIASVPSGWPQTSPKAPTRPVTFSQVWRRLCFRCCRWRRLISCALRVRCLSPPYRPLDRSHSPSVTFCLHTSPPLCWAKLVSNLCAPRRCTVFGSGWGGAWAWRGDRRRISCAPQARCLSPPYHPAGPTRIARLFHPPARFFPLVGPKPAHSSTTTRVLSGRYGGNFFRLMLLTLVAPLDAVLGAAQHQPLLRLCVRRTRWHAFCVL